MNSLRSFIYTLLKLSNDINAVQQGKVGRRIGRRLAGKITGRALGKVFK